MQLDPRPEFHRVRVWPDSNGTLTAHTTGGQRSSRATSFRGANALVALPSKNETGGKKELLGGELADAILIDL